MSDDNKIIQFPTGGRLSPIREEEENETYFADSETQTIEEVFESLMDYHRENRLLVYWDSHFASLIVVKGRFYYSIQATTEALMSSRKVTVTNVSTMPRFSNMTRKLYDKNHNVLAHISKHGQLVFKGDEEFVVVRVSKGYIGDVLIRELDDITDANCLKVSARGYLGGLKVYQ